MRWSYSSEAPMSVLMTSRVKKGDGEKVVGGEVWVHMENKATELSKLRVVE